jgi:hypothetical protein
MNIILMARMMTV